MGAGFSTVTPPAQSATAVAQAVWSYTPRSLTDIQNLVSAIQNNNPGAVSDYTDLTYVPVPYYAGQVTADQVAAFIDNAIRNYNLLNPFVGFINNNPYNLWTPNAVGAFLSSQNMSQTSVALLLAYAGATQMGQALSYLSGNYTNVVNAFNVVSPTTGATVMANMNASQAAFLLSYPVMPVTQAALILSNSAMPVAQAANILNVMAVNTAAIMLSNVMAVNTAAIMLSNMSVTQAAQILSNPNMSVTQATLILNNANMSITQAAQILSNPNMSVTQAAQILTNSNMSITQAATILNNSNMSATQAASIVSIAVNYNVTQVVMELSLVSTSQLVNITANPNMSATSLAAILSNAGLSANNAQLVLYGLAQNYYYNLWTNTVTENAGSTTISTNVTISSPLYSQNLTISSGVTVTCGTHTCFFVAQSFNNYGTIVSPYGAPGGTSLDSAGAGGTGGGGIVVVAITAVLGTLDVSGSPGRNAVSYTGASGTGAAGGAGIFYVVSGVTVPLGGTGGNATAGYIGAAGLNGGGGGGSDRDYYGAPGGNATVYSFSSPNDMVAYILQGLSDWWLINTLNKAPSSTTPLAFMYGSGGGAGAVTSGWQAAGGGGGGAGEVVAYGYNIVSGNITAVGGTGGGAASGCSTCPAGGGGGGAGGLVFIFYGATSGTITADLVGGAGGTGGAGGSNGAAGSTGVLYIAAVTVNG